MRGHTPREPPLTHADVQHRAPQLQSRGGLVLFLQLGQLPGEDVEGRTLVVVAGAVYATLGRDGILLHRPTRGHHPVLPPVGMQVGMEVRTPALAHAPRPDHTHGHVVAHRPPPVLHHAVPMRDVRHRLRVLPGVSLQALHDVKGAHPARLQQQVGMRLPGRGPMLLLQSHQPSDPANVVAHQRRHLLRGRSHRPPRARGVPHPLAGSREPGNQSHFPGIQHHPTVRVGRPFDSLGHSPKRYLLDHLHSALPGPDAAGGTAAGRVRNSPPFSSSSSRTAPIPATDAPRCAAKREAGGHASSCTDHPAGHGGGRRITQC